ncbi:MAG: hypothetical protein GY923_05665 [Aestuariibacter sp.]|nr:hypothetical protein [Aestuariibacter sp.]
MLPLMAVGGFVAIAFIFAQCKKHVT